MKYEINVGESTVEVELEKVDTLKGYKVESRSGHCVHFSGGPTPGTSVLVSGERKPVGDNTHWNREGLQTICNQGCPGGSLYVGQEKSGWVILIQDDWGNPGRFKALVKATSFCYATEAVGALAAYVASKGEQRLLVETFGY